MKKFFNFTKVEPLPTGVFQKQSLPEEQPPYRIHLRLQPDGSGVDAVVATVSAGPAVKTVVVGLLSDVSLQSARRLAESTYSRVVDTLDLSDHRKPDQQMDSIARSRPDLVLLSGGTDGGASRSIQKMLEAIGLACYLLRPAGDDGAVPADQRDALPGTIERHVSVGNVDQRSSHAVRPGVRAGWPAVGSGAWPTGRRRAESDRARQELRLAARLVRDELQRRADSQS